MSSRPVAEIGQQLKDIASASKNRVDTQIKTNSVIKEAAQQNGITGMGSALTGRTVIKVDKKDKKPPPPSTNNQ